MKNPNKTIYDIKNEKLEVSELRYRRIFEAVQEGIILIDFNTGMILDVNNYLIDLLGYSKIDFFKKYLWEINAFKNVVASKGNFSTWRKKKYVQFENLLLKTKTGKKISVEIIANAYQTGGTTIIQCDVRDITERNKIEEALRESERKFKNILENTRDIIFRISPLGIIQYVSPQIEEFFGYKPEDLVGKHLKKTTPMSEMPKVLGAISRVLSGEVIKNIEIKQIDAKGNIIPMEVNPTPVKENDKIVAVQGVMRNIVDRKQIVKDLENAKMAAQNVLEDLQIEKERMAEAKAKDEALLGSIGEGLFAVDPDGKVIIVNKMTEKLLGFTAAELLGKILTEVSFLEDEQGNRISGAQRPEMLAGNSLDKTAKITSYYAVRKDGTKIPVSITATPVFLNEKMIGTIIVFRDITREKEIEKLRVDFLSLASHQLRTPLSGTKWLIETIRKGVIGELNSKQKEYLGSIYQINERMIRLVSDMLNVLMLEDGIAEIKKQEISVAKLYEELFLMMEPASQNRGIALRNALKNQSAFFIQSDFQILRSILECFVSNAISYSKDGQEVVLDAKEEPAAAVFFVKDNGIGIPEEEQVKISERFYRASNAKAFKPDGTGLGLYIAFLLAQKIGGKISFESKEKKGTTFYLRIPKKVDSGDKFNNQTKSKL